MSNNIIKRKQQSLPKKKVIDQLQKDFLYIQTLLSLTQMDQVKWEVGDHGRWVWITASGKRRELVKVVA